ncbi:hypothetical protein [Psychromonas ossibalaenae]|uniref:hypothetical protein n=1 Tax=Psychromonas ossibalaenae TaxID=444922 RepID=UPI0003757B6C|nr:hypothetical protein [Psychromonas ossibalaenae]
MHKVVDLKLTPIFSPVCQALIHEQIQDYSQESQSELYDNYSELLIIRLDGTVIGYSTFDVEDGDMISVNSLHFRSIIKDHALSEYWLSRLLKRRLSKNNYLQFLLAS